MAGILGTMMEANVAVAVPKGLPALPRVSLTVVDLTPTQIAALASADGAALSTAATTLINNAPAAQRVALAQSIAAYVARTKTSTAAAAVLTGLVTALPNAGSSILQVALAITPALAATLTSVLPASAQTALNSAVVDAAAAVASAGAGSTVISFTNPLTVSAN